MYVTPNILAYLALLGWPIVAIVLYRRLPLPAALVWSILAPYLILPEGLSIDFPVLPGFDKHTIPSLCALVLVIAAGRRKIRRRGVAARDSSLDEGTAPNTGARAAGRGRSRPALLFMLLAAVAVAAPIPTNLLNGDSLFIGGRYLQGTGIKDVWGAVILTLLSLTPFLLARRHLATAEDQLMLMRALIAACLVYSILMLFEVRMSPQLHRMLYGYHAHSFAQHVRGGHYRPMVFLEHGLRVGIFVAMAALSCAAMWRVAQKARAKGRARLDIAALGQDATADARPRARRAASRTTERPPSYWAISLIWIAAVLVLSRNLGATLILVLLLPVILLFGIRIQLVIAAVFAVLILVYPMARGSGIIPTERLLNFAAAVNEDRASSLEFRLINEERLLERANEKPLFGWAGWGRSRVYDPQSGDDISTTDGSWVILIGSNGWVGYLATFGLLTAPILMMLRRARAADQAAAGLTLVLAANLIDLIPNSSLTPITWLIAGSLAGRVEQMADVPKAAGRRRSSHSPALASETGRTATDPGARRPLSARTSARGA